MLQVPRLAALQPEGTALDVGHGLAGLLMDPYGFGAL